jgi:hypothetical protein
MGPPASLLHVKPTGFHGGLSMERHVKEDNTAPTSAPKHDRSNPSADTPPLDDENAEQPLIGNLPDGSAASGAMGLGREEPDGLGG